MFLINTLELSFKVYKSATLKGDTQWGAMILRWFDSCICCEAVRTAIRLTDLAAAIIVGTYKPAPHTASDVWLTYPLIRLSASTINLNSV